MTRPAIASDPGGASVDLDPALLREMYRRMLLCRALDVRAWALSRQGRAFFIITGRGHEAAQIGCAFAIRPGRDWVVPYYRDLGLAIGLGIPPRDIFLAILARASDPSSGGRQLPMHFSDAALRIVSGSSVVASQIPHGVGLALAARLAGDDVIATTFFGEGATSKGDFHESMNFAAVLRLPVVFVCENNGYAISLPQNKQMVVGSVVSRAAGYGMPGILVDGNDPIATYLAMAEARDRALAGGGPTLIEATMYRFTPHSSDDDDRTYRSREEVEAALAKDPIPAFGRRLIELGYLDEIEDQVVHESVAREVDDALAFAETGPEPSPRDLLRHVYRDDPVASTENFVTIKNVIQAIHDALDEEMGRDSRVILIGQDIGVRGGVFRATEGLLARYGVDRVIDAPLAESAIVGVAIGASIAGFRPVAEIQFADYLWPAADQIISEAARMRYRSNGVWSCPLVIRAPFGAGIHGGLYHSQSVEATFAHIPGIKVVIPSTAADAKGLLISAIRDPDPVLFLEHKRTYRLVKDDVPDEDYCVPLSKAIVRKPGRTLTAFAYGMMVHETIKAADAVIADGIEAEVIDLRTISPLDKSLILASIRRTHKAIIVHEDSLTGGIGGEIAAIIASEAFDALDGPIVRVASPDAPPTPFNMALEDAYLPNATKIAEAMRSLAAY